MAKNKAYTFFFFGHCVNYEPWRLLPLKFFLPPCFLFPFATPLWFPVFLALQQSRLVVGRIYGQNPVIMYSQVMETSSKYKYCIKTPHRSCNTESLITWCFAEDCGGMRCSIVPLLFQICYYRFLAGLRSRSFLGLRRYFEIPFGYDSDSKTFVISLYSCMTIIKAGSKQKSPASQHCFLGTGSVPVRLTYEEPVAHCVSEENLRFFLPRLNRLETLTAKNLNPLPIGSCDLIENLENAGLWVFKVKNPN